MDIKTARMKVNMSQAELAKRINVSQTMVNFLETGKEFPSTQIQRQINKILKTNVDWSTHPQAPLTGMEKVYMGKLYERMVANGQEPHGTMKFLASQNNADLRKLFEFAGVVVQPMSANGFPEMKRRK